MGEYYDWVNLTKKQYISPADFDLGNKISESSWEKDSILTALFELMKSDWTGDTILWLGDESVPRSKYEGNNPAILNLYESASRAGYADDLLGYKVDTFQNIAKRFKQTKVQVMDAYRIYKEFGETEDMEAYGLDLVDPEKGNFTEEGLWFRYVINKTKSEYIDQSERLRPDSSYGFSGFPALMAFGRTADPGGGPWIGDKLELSNNKPSEEYKILHAKYVWDNFIW